MVSGNILLLTWRFTPSILHPHLVGGYLKVPRIIFCVASACLYNNYSLYWVDFLKTCCWVFSWNRIRTLLYHKPWTNSLKIYAHAPPRSPSSKSRFTILNIPERGYILYWYTTLSPRTERSSAIIVPYLLQLLYYMVCIYGSKMQLTD